MRVWTPKLNAVLGSLVVTVGFWLMMGELAPAVAAAVAVGAAGFLAWRGATAGGVWAWATLLLGVESLAWPITTMVRVRLVTETPSDEQMGEIVKSVLGGGVAAIFWLSFAYGIFRWIGRQNGEASQPSTVASGSAPVRSGKGKRRRKG